MAQATLTSYDKIAYSGKPFAQAHPNRLATLATLFRMKPAPVARCRVLELGCGDGGNLIPLAVELPESEFIGIDLAAMAIGNGQLAIKDLKLDNISLHHLDILDLAGDFGTFDYILAHGVYSWVPLKVREKILSVCRERLAPSGVAYISYNTYPGSHLREMVREMMLFHTRSTPDPQQQISRAREIVSFLADSPQAASLYRVALKEYMERLKRRSADGLYHDELSEVHAPVYFYKFMEQASGHGLQYLAEAEFFQMKEYLYPAGLPDPAPLPDTQDIIASEQYLDFLKCRWFRQTLLCHREVPLNRALKPEQMSTFYAASEARPVSPEPDILRGSVSESFRNAGGCQMRMKRPLAKAALWLLGEAWPQSLHFDDLLAGARSLIDSKLPVEDDALVLGEVLLRTYSSGLVELTVHKPAFASAAGERPVASPLARRQVERGFELTNLRHDVIKIEDALARRLLPLLDGSRDRQALLRECGAVSPDELEMCLTRLARLALLVT